MDEGYKKLCFSTEGQQSRLMVADRLMKEREMQVGRAIDLLNYNYIEGDLLPCTK